MEHFKSQQANAQKEDFIERLLSLTDEELSNFILEARSIGISEDQIIKGLNLIKQIKKSH